MFPTNPQKSRKKILYLVVVFMVLLALAGLTARRQHITTAEAILQTVVAPVQGVFQRLTRSVESVFVTVKNYQFVMAENDRLREQLREAASLEARLAELRQENVRLRRLLEFREQSEHALKAAQVIARDPSNWFNTLTINKGSLDGVAVNMAVITTDGLIGNVLSVSPASAQVILLTDGRRSVSALVQRSREPGLIGVVDNDLERPGYLRIRDLPRDANIQPGDTIISSGLGGIFPKGLVIGFVQETFIDDMGLTRHALVQPAANFNRLEEVLIVFPNAPRGDGS